MTESILCLGDSKVIKTGSICIFHQNKLISVDNEIATEEFLFSKKNMTVLTNEEYIYLKSIDPQKRIKMHQHFQNCQNIKPNDKIIINKSDLEWVVTNKNVTEEKITYTILSSNNESKEIEPNDIRKIISNSNQKISNFSNDRSSTLSMRRKSPLKFINELFLSNCTNLDKFTVVSNDSPFVKDELVEVINQGIYGRVKLVITNFHTDLVCLAMNPCICEKLMDILDQIEFKTNTYEFKGIVVQLNCVKKFSEFAVISTDIPNICKSNIKFIEDYFNTSYKKNDLIKYSENMKRQYAYVVNTCLVNNEICLKVNWVYPIEITKSESQYVKVSDITKVEKPELEFKYFDGVIMTPYPILTIEKFESKHVTINDETYFILKNSLKKIKGFLIWTGIINGAPVGVLKLKKNYSLKIPRKFRINEHRSNYFKDLVYNEDCVLYMVPLCHLRREKYIELQEVVKDFLKVSDDNLNIVINRAMTLKEKSVLPLIIENMNVIINLKLYPTILPLLFERKQFETMKILLNKSTSDNSVDILLLDLALKCLKFDDKILFELLVKKCTDSNAKLENGETFLTNAFKENMTTDEIIYLIRMNIFDINLANDNNETSLILACDKLMVDVIKIIMSFSDFDPLKISEAQWKVLEKNKNNSSIEEKDKIIEIIKIMSSKNSNAKIEKTCIICKNTPVNDDSGIGNTTCSDCHEQTSQC